MSHVVTLFVMGFRPMVGLIYAPVPGLLMASFRNPAVVNLRARDFVCA